MRWRGVGGNYTLMTECSITDNQYSSYLARESNTNSTALEIHDASLIHNTEKCQESHQSRCRFCSLWYHIWRTARAWICMIPKGYLIVPTLVVLMIQKLKKRQCTCPKAYIDEECSRNVLNRVENEMFPRTFFVKIIFIRFFWLRRSCPLNPLERWLHNFFVLFEYV